ncbi:LysE family translocator [Haliea sp. E1-2-M8]|uniref:LysE family translocator n=1 Tax=Haliea sp. E1-2-M8 TaxID=3064706 RepID=UPI002718390F|nr:LysE family translocator [Haliea sp. E1-2-M8]MDO8861136.1 LysE family translocator [Haliea sp. E1-2-M8]
MTLSAWLSLLGVCLLGAMSPGPTLAVVLRSALAGGRPVGLAAAVAHGLAVGCYALFTVGGLSVLIARSPQTFFALQLAGAGWLIYLGVSALRSGGNPSATTAGAGAAPQTSPWQGAVNGFLIAFLNPKLALFMLALFSQFLPAEPNWPIYALMVTTVAVTDALWYCLVVLLVSRPAWMALLQRKGQRVDKLLGAVLIVLGAVVILRLVL